MNTFYKSLRTSSGSGSKVKTDPSVLQCMSICGVTYFSAVTAMVMLTSVFYTMPIVYNDSSGVFWLRIAAAVYIFAGIITNFTMLSVRNSYLPADGTGVLPGPDWTHCTPCDRHVPPRTHHCILCQRCILWRDHHCFFTGSCIGIMNQRYFVLFCICCAVGSAYSVYVNAVFLSMSYSSSLYDFIFPLTVLGWLFGFQTFGFLYVVALVYVSVLTMCGSTGVAVWQLLLIAKGQTSFEYLEGRGKKSLGIMRNIRIVFGPYWLLKFFFPFPIDDHLSWWNLSKLV